MIPIKLDIIMMVLLSLQAISEVDAVDARIYSSVGMQYFTNVLIFNKGAGQSDKSIVLTNTEVDIEVFTSLMKFTRKCHEANITSYKELEASQIDFCDIEMLHQCVHLYSYLQFTGNSSKWFIYGFIRCLKSVDIETLIEVFKDHMGLFSTENLKASNILFNEFNIGDFSEDDLICDYAMLNTMKVVGDLWFFPAFKTFKIEDEEIFKDEALQINDFLIKNNHFESIIFSNLEVKLRGKSIFDDIKLPFLKSCEIDNVLFNLRDHNSINALIQNSPQLENISITNGNLHGSSIKLLIDSFSKSKKLKILNLSYNCINFDGFKYLFDRFENDFKNLVKLDLANDRMNNCILESGLIHLKNLIHLKSLNLSANKLSDNSFDSIVEYISNNRTIENLNLSGANLKVEQVNRLFECISESNPLKVLNLSFSESLPETGEIFIRNPMICSNLIELNLSKSLIPNASFIQGLLNNAVKLKVLDLSDARIDRRTSMLVKLLCDKNNSLRILL